MDSKQITDFIEKLYSKTRSNKIEWEELEIDEIAMILKKLSGTYSSIIGAYYTLNKSKSKISVIGKFRVKVFYDEEHYNNQEYVFLALTNARDYSDSIVISEDELTIADIESVRSIYRNIEVKDIGTILDDWF